MRQTVGVVLQFVVLCCLPMLVGFQLFFGMRLILMPALTLVAIAVFFIGHLLRQGGGPTDRPSEPEA